MYIYLHSFSHLSARSPFCSRSVPIENEGVDLAIRIQWMETLGSIITNFKESIMEFDWNGKCIKLQGEPTLTHESMTLK